MYLLFSHLIIKERRDRRVRTGQGMRPLQPEQLQGVLWSQVHARGRQGRLRDLLAGSVQDGGQAAARHQQRAHIPHQALPGQAGAHRERVRALSHLLADTQLLAQGRGAAAAQRGDTSGRVRCAGRSRRLRARHSQGELSGRFEVLVAADRQSRGLHRRTPQNTQVGFISSLIRVISLDQTCRELILTTLNFDTSTLKMNSNLFVF